MITDDRCCDVPDYQEIDRRTITDEQGYNYDVTHYQCAACGTIIEISVYQPEAKPL